MTDGFSALKRLREGFLEGGELWELEQRKHALKAEVKWLEDNAKKLDQQSKAFAHKEARKSQKEKRFTLKSGLIIGYFGFTFIFALSLAQADGNNFVPALLMSVGLFGLLYLLWKVLRWVDKSLNLIQRSIIAGTIPIALFIFFAGISYERTGEPWYHFGETWPFMCSFGTIITIFELWLWRNQAKEKE